MDAETEKKYKKVQAVLQRMQLQNNYKWGYLGERFAKVQSEKVRIESATGTAKYRIPDILTENELIEIKNVKRQRLTNQIKDFLIYCKRTNRRLIIYTREDAILSPRLSELVENNKLEVRYLSRIFTKLFQQRLYEAMRPMIERALAGMPLQAEQLNQVKIV